VQHWHRDRLLEPVIDLSQPPHGTCFVLGIVPAQRITELQVNIAVRNSCHEIEALIELA